MHHQKRGKARVQNSQKEKEENGLVNPKTREKNLKICT